MLRTLIIFLIIFSIIVVIHEFGHYFWAKRAGIRVREFSLGMGPKLFAKQAEDGTTYTIRMLPLGGYVRLAGLNEEETIQPGMEIGLLLDEQDTVQRINTSENTYDIEELPFQVDQVDLVHEMVIKGYVSGQDGLQTYNVFNDAEIVEPDGTVVLVAPIEARYESASVFDKILTNFGGPLNNFILSIIAFAVIGFMIPGIPTYSNELGTIADNSPAQAAGLQEGDKVLEVAGIEVDDWNSLVTEISKYPDQTVDFIVERQGTATQETMPVAVGSGEDAEGNAIGQIGVTWPLSTSVSSRLLFGFTATWNVIAQVLLVLSTIFTQGFNINIFGGPVAMAQATSQVANQGILDITAFMASLSTNLGIVNLLPIPALDGGKIVLNLVELVRGKPLSQEKEGIITIIGVVLLLILMVAVTWNDIRRAFF